MWRVQKPEEPEIMEVMCTCSSRPTVIRVLEASLPGADSMCNSPACLTAGEKGVLQTKTSAGSRNLVEHTRALPEGIGLRWRQQAYQRSQQQGLPGKLPSIFNSFVKKASAGSIVCRYLSGGLRGMGHGFWLAQIRGAWGRKWSPTTN
jgi:hypothetical protein